MADVKLTVRLPEGLHGRLATIAVAERRSLNGELVRRLEASLSGPDQGERSLAAQKLESGASGASRGSTQPVTSGPERNVSVVEKEPKGQRTQTCEHGRAATELCWRCDV